jgi:hypothetical protein
VNWRDFGTHNGGENQILWAAPSKLGLEGWQGRLGWTDEYGVPSPAKKDDQDPKVGTN